MLNKKVLVLCLLTLVPSIASIFITSCDRASTFKIIGQNVTVLQDGNFDDVLIEIRLNVREISQSGTLMNSPFITSAYATSPAPNRFENAITAISIVAEEDFSPNEPAGTNLIHHFEIRDRQVEGEIVDFPISSLDGFSLFLTLKDQPASPMTTWLIVGTTCENQLFATQTESITIN